MKKYTVVYTVPVGMGNYVVCKEFIETDDLKSTLDGFDNVWHVFEGHCVDATETAKYTVICSKYLGLNGYTQTDICPIEVEGSLQEYLDVYFRNATVWGVLKGHHEILEGE